MLEAGIIHTGDLSAPGADPGQLLRKDPEGRPGRDCDDPGTHRLLRWL